MATQIRLRRGTAAQWAAANPVLALGEPGFETDTGILRIGDGETTFASLVPIVTIGAVNSTLENALEEINKTNETSIQLIELKQETAVNTLNVKGQYFTDLVESVAGEMGFLKSISAFMFNVLDGGDRNNLYSEKDSMDFGNASSVYNPADVIDGDNAESSEITFINVVTNLPKLDEWKQIIDSTVEKVNAAITTANNAEKVANGFASRITALENAINGGNA